MTTSKLVDTTILKHLHTAAMKARSQNYSPYSHYAVGCALLLEDDSIVSGCNIENGAYSVCLCAERVALFKARSESKKKIKAVFTVTEDAESSCGSCLQVISELAPKAYLIYSGLHMEKIRILSLKELLPHQFTLKTPE